MEYNGMSVIDYNDLMKQQEFDFLDSIDLEEYLKHGEWSILKIMNEIQKNHGAAYEKESSIFNAIEQDDLMKYIRKRYKGKYDFYCYTEIRVIVKK